VRYFVILSLTYCFCAGQAVTLGVIAGGRTTSDMGQGATPASRFYDIGPTVELGLPFNLSLEADAIYHRHGYTIAYGSNLYSTFESERANSWEFPLLVKYKLGVPAIKPFFEVGAAPRTISGNISQVGSSVNIPNGGQIPFANHFKTNWSATVGVVAGGGVQFRIGRLRLSPELRYTYWKDTPIVIVLSDGPTFYSNQHQFDVLLGIGWKVK
jgi:hypothetical protein